MPKYLVSWSEIHTATVAIEADSAEDAVSKAKSGEYEVDEILLDFTDVVGDSFSAEEEREVFIQEN